MADITYPSGIDGFATLAAATQIPFVATAFGSIGLGDGKPAAGQKAALGVIFQFTVVAASTTSLTIAFQATNDGSNWYDIDEYDIAVASTLTDRTFRLHVQPFTFGANAVRVLVSGGGSSPEGTVAIDARLTGLFEVVGGVV
jgi:hypothetical protein